MVAIALAVSLTVAGLAASTFRNEKSVLGARHFRSGEWSLEHNDLPGAIDQLRKALVFSPDNESYRLALADSLVRANHLDEAESHLQQLADEDPGNGRVNALLAEIAERRHQNQVAIERFQRAVYEYWPADQIPMRRRARWELVRLLEQSGRTSEAMGELMQLNESAPNPEERVRIGFDLLRYGAFSEAARTFQEAALLRPTDAEPRRGLGMVHFELGQYISARHDFQTAKRLNPGDQAINDWLSLTNQVIDLDPLLPGLSTAERERRSRNVLKATIDAVGSCRPGIASSEEGAAELAAATALLEPKPNTKTKPDADQMQQTATQLWRDRHLFCSGAVPQQDKALDTAIARVRGE